jgi:hypothetical protein
VKFKELLPTSPEVTFIPLTLVYVFVGVTMSRGLFPSMVAPAIYLLLMGMFIAHGAIYTPIRFTFAKLIITLILVSPLFLVLSARR